MFEGLNKLELYIIYLIFLLKVRLPVCIIKVPQTYIALLPADSKEKFICSIDQKITGDIHFDVSKLERQEDEAYVSL
jgi:hypothetical protein